MKHCYSASFLLFLSGFFAFLPLAAYDFEVGKLYYNITSVSDLTVEVTYRDKTYNGSSLYSGDVVIPNVVKFGNRSFTVVGIGSNAFNNCSALKSVRIGNGVKSIGSNAFFNCRRLTAIDIPSSRPYTTARSATATV